MKVAFNEPSQTGREVDYMIAAIKNKRIAGGGRFTHLTQNLLETKLGVKKALLTTSCTAALEMSALLLNIQPGDEVIVPSFSFVSIPNAFALRGARPVFADVRPDTLNLDEAKLERHITPRTRAIVVMHYAGIACEMDAILELAARHSLPVVEDNAHGLFARYKNRMLGSLGCMATQSFHQTKNFTCGEGGALLLNDPRFVARSEIIWEKGTDRLKFSRGQVEKYTWVDLGSSFLPAELLAAFLYAQLEKPEEIQAPRGKAWNFYYASLQSWSKENGLLLPTVPSYVENPYHLFYLLLPSVEERDRLIHYLADREIESAFHYVPLHLSKMGRSFGGKEGDCPVCEEMSERLLRLPFHNGLTGESQAQVVSALKNFPFL